MRNLAVKKVTNHPEHSEFDVKVALFDYLLVFSALITHQVKMFSLAFLTCDLTLLLLPGLDFFEPFLQDQLASFVDIGFVAGRQVYQAQHHVIFAAFVLKVLAQIVLPLVLCHGQLYDYFL